MPTAFEELNLYAYNTARGKALDVVIWCLGPLVDETRDYGMLRLYLAAATCKVCRSVMRLED